MLPLGQRTAIVILLHYHELKAEARANSLSNLKQNTDVSEVEHRGRTNEIIAKKASVGKTNVAYLLAIYRNRPDLFERVFDGELTIGGAYRIMKEDEKGEEEIDEEDSSEELRKNIERMLEEESSQQISGLLIVNERYNLVYIIYLKRVSNRF